jgi:hypothetical protein
MLTKCIVVSRRLECVQEFLRAAADVRAVNSEGNTAASIAAGFGHAKCVAALQSYGGSIDTRRAMLLSAQRRLADRHVVAAPERELRERMDRIAAVWERVLESAALRLDRARSSEEAALLHAAEHTTVSHGFSDVEEEDGSLAAASDVWVRGYDPTSCWHYYYNSITGESLWGSVGITDAASPADGWALLTDVTTGAQYMQHSQTGVSEWVQAPNEWRLCWEAASQCAYFELIATGLTEWCTVELSAALKELCRDGAANVWTRSLDTVTSMSYFTHVYTGQTLWGGTF